MNAIDYARIDRVYLKAGYTDMRKGIDGLCMIIQASMKLDPFSNCLFLFCGRNPSSIKGILWEGDGFLMLNKRLANGKFKWPRNSEEALLLTDQQIRWLLEGLDIHQKKAIRKSRPNRIL